MYNGLHFPNQLYFGCFNQQFHSEKHGIVYQKLIEIAMREQWKPM